MVHNIAFTYTTAAPAVGTVYYNTQTNTMMKFDGTNWVLAGDAAFKKPKFTCHEAHDQFIVDAHEFDVHAIFNFHDYLRKHCSDRYTVINNYFYFKYEKDRTLFLLKWA